MKPLKIKNKCIKRKLSKCEDVVRTYDKIQTAFADILETDKNIKSFECNVLTETFEDNQYTTDFLCIKTNGEYMVRECVYRKKLSLPRTCKLLDFSKNYWSNKGVTDWGIVIDKESNNEN